MYLAQSDSEENTYPNETKIFSVLCFSYNILHPSINEILPSLFNKLLYCCGLR